jgi:hypothetical protein
MGLLTLYGASRDEITEYVSFARNILNSPLRSTEAARDLFNPAYLTFLDFEQAASFERHWHPNLIPGILQTEEYAYEVYRKIWKRNEEDLTKLIDARLERQQLLEGSEGLDFHFLLDEAILRRPIGTEKLMRQQAEKILELNSRHRIKIQLVPLAIGLHPGIRGPFIMLEFDDAQDDVLYLETPRAEFFSRDEPATTAEYRLIFSELEQVALSDQEMLERVEEALVKAKNRES